MDMPSLFNTGLMVVDVIFPILATASVVLRFYARKGGRAYAIFADDWIILATLFFCWANTVNTIVGAAEAGIDKAKVEPARAGVITARTLWIEGFLLATALALIKVSILHFYYRIFVTKCATWYKISILAMHGIIAAWWFSSIMCQLLVTVPIRAAFNPLIPFKYRYDYNRWALAFAAMSMFFDIVILLYPLPVIGKLMMDFKRKLSVIGIFWLGAFCCVAAAVRFYFLYIEIYKVSSGIPGTNPYTNITNGFIWAHIEPNCSIIAACLPTYGIFFRSGRSAHSFIRSFRSMFSVTDSRGDSSMGKSRSSKGATLTSGSSQNSLTHGTSGVGYYELREESVDGRAARAMGKTQTTVKVEATHDVEAQRGMGGIGVTREFRSERFPN